MTVQDLIKWSLSPPAALYSAGVFLAGVLVGYVIRAFISARRRARARRRSRRHDFEES
jgi:uncharacterized integral membrane protein